MDNPRTLVWKRRREVTSLIVRGLTVGEIAVTLGIKPETVSNDVRVIKSGNNEDLNAHCKNELNAQLYLNVKERIRELWRMFENASTESLALRILQELRLNDERILKRLPRLKTRVEVDKDKEDIALIEQTIDKIKYNITKPIVADNSKAPPFIGGVNATGVDKSDSASDDKLKQTRENIKSVDKMIEEMKAEEKAKAESRDENPPDSGDTKS